MMQFSRYFFLLGATLTFTMASVSCKRCYECIVVEDGVSTYAYPQICATKSDFESYVERCESEFGSFDDIECECGEIQ